MLPSACLYGFIRVSSGVREWLLVRVIGVEALNERRALLEHLFYLCAFVFRRTFLNAFIALKVPCECPRVSE